MNQNPDSIYFEVNKKERNKIKRWLSELKKKHPKVFKDKDPSLKYIITPTGIGNGVEVEEQHTKEKIDVTDYSSW